MKKILTALMLAGTVCAGAAYAEETPSLFASYNFGTDTVTVSGTAAEPKAMVSIVILPETVDIGSLTPESINENQYVTQQLRNESDGSFEIQVRLPESTEGGVYSVYAFCGDDELTSQFTYLNGDAVEELTEKLNSASESAAAEIIKENSEALGVEDDCLPYADEIAKMLCENRPSGGFEAAELISELDRCSAFALIRHGAELDGIIRRYGEAFGGDGEAELAALDEDGRESFVEAVKENENGGDSVEFLYRCILMGKLYDAPSYAAMGNYIEEYNEKSGLDADLEKAGTDVYKKLFDMKLRTFSELESKLASLLDSSSQNGGGSSPSGGGSHGGGGGGGVPSTNNGTEITKPSPAPEPGRENAYTDIENHWCRECIERLSEMGIISGYDDGSFKPDNYVTRAEFVKLIVTALDIPVSYDGSFSDVSESDWFGGYVGAAAERGIVNGYGSEFRPNDLIKRQDAAVIIYRITGGSGSDTNALYSDSADIADYAAEAVNALTAQGIISGSDGRFLPNNGTTRAEAAKLIDKMLEVGGV